MDGKKKLKNKKPSLPLLASTIFGKSSTHFFFFRNTQIQWDCVAHENEDYRWEKM